ncbi:cobalt-precorrin-6A reductase [Baekduia soli]|uniref:Cobalt-precorrin-6A reductase n=1 Tax=Baekduia soli TaxID=496014 RepID=A0A5B8U209_9ACTN|nr:cobalt-precorrin-6A reductase [Baekduia soli]QEC47033.1 cobalt-precorrin-6A reductase [Baekduia soli]
MSGRVLILGGTAEARALAAELQGAGIAVVSSLAGRVARPRLPVGEVRIGGFGGTEGLATWLREHAVAAVVDATHPFAQRISASAATAAAATGTPLLRLERPGWTAGSGDHWTWVDDLDEAARAVNAAAARRVLVTSGRQGLAAFAALDAWCLIRCVDPPDAPLPRAHQVVLDRGPYTLAGERALLREHEVDLLVTKDSGGDHTAPKLQAAREAGIEVVVVRRPPRPVTSTVADVARAAAWAVAQVSG